MESSIELLKSTFPFSAHIEELNKIENQLSMIQSLLGSSALNRIMLDAAIMQDYRCLFYTANPILLMRERFDPDYPFRAADWGGGYPRPFHEISNLFK